MSTSPSGRRGGEDGALTRETWGEPESAVADREWIHGCPLHSELRAATEWIPFGRSVLLIEEASGLGQ